MGGTWEDVLFQGCYIGYKHEDVDANFRASVLTGTCDDNRLKACAAGNVAHTHTYKQTRRHTASLCPVHSSAPLQVFLARSPPMNRLLLAIVFSAKDTAEYALGGGSLDPGYKRRVFRSEGTEF